MSIRTKLLLLVLAILIPALVGGIYGLHQMRQRQVEEASERLMELVHGIAQSVEREIAVKAAFLNGLAVSPALQADDLRAFYKHAVAAAPTFDQTIVLHDLSLKQRVNTRREFGAALPAASSAFSELRPKLGEDATIVSDLYFAPIGKQFSFAVQVPVKRAGKAVYYLSMGSFTSNLQALVDDQRLRPGWNAAILDRKGVLLARRIRPQEFVGKPGTHQMLAMLRQQSTGVFETVRLDGVPVYTAYGPAGSTGWTIAVSMPKAEIAEQSARIFRFIATLAALLLALSGALAWLIARSINQSITELVKMSKALGRQEPIGEPRFSTPELQVVATELRAADERLRAINETLEARVQQAVADNQRAQFALLQHQKLEALGRLTGGIAHDFNNILQTLSVSLEMAGRMAMLDPVKFAIQTGKRAVERGTQLTRQLLSFGRTTIGASRTINVGEHIRENLELIRGALREDIRIDSSFPEGLWLVTVDTVQLDLALLNIALNSRDAMPQGGVFRIAAQNVRLDEKTVPDLVAGEYVCLSLRDSGVGIAADLLPNVFEPFFTTKDTGKGSGLGLAQVYGFVKQCGGAVTVTSVLGEGTELLLYFPRAKGAADNSPQDAAAEEHRDALAHGKAILFVDDDPLIRQIMVPALHSEGFTVHHAAHAKEALELVRSVHIDLVISDIVMPGGMSGLHLADAIRIECPAIKIVLSTGYAEQLPKEPSYRLLRKPYGVRETVTVIRAELGLQTKTEG